MAPQKSTGNAGPAATGDQPFPLVKLPPELRTSIYHYYFSDIRRQYCDAMSITTISDHLNLLQSNGEVRREAASIFYKDYMCKTDGDELSFWSLSIDWRSEILTRIKFVMQSLTKYDTSAKIDIECKTSFPYIHLDANFVDALLAHIGSQVSSTVPRSAFQVYADHIVDEDNYNEPDFDHYRDNEFMAFLEVQGSADGHHSVPFDYSCSFGTLEVEYTCAWRVDEEYYWYCDERFSLTGPLAELD